MKVLIGILLCVCFANPSAAQESQVKSWKIASSLIGMKFNKAEAILKKYRFAYNDDEENNGFHLTAYDQDNNGDYLHLAAKNKTVVLFTFAAEPYANARIQNVNEFYYAFEKAMLKGNYVEDLSMKPAERSPLYYRNRSKGQSVRITLERSGSDITYADVTIFKDEYEKALITESEPEVVKDPYAYATLQEFADVLNTNLKFGRVNIENPMISFDVLGKSETGKRSVQFIVKYESLYIRMIYPGTDCESGIKDIKAEFTGKSGISKNGDKSFLYLVFNYQYKCKGNTYTDLYFFFDYLSKDFETRTVSKISACCKWEKPKGVYDFTRMQTFADTLNATLRSARINKVEPYYNFTILGKTDLVNRSIQFITKENNLYLRLNYPASDCNTGTKDVAVNFSGNSGTSAPDAKTGKSYLYYEFDLIYQCMGTKFNGVYVFLENRSKQFEDQIMLKLMGCCIPDIFGLPFEKPAYKSPKVLLPGN